MTPPALPAHARPAAPSPSWAVGGAVLVTLTLVAWAHLLFGAEAGVQVVNRSGQVLSGLRVCGETGACVERERLWPHQAWRVPVQGEATVQVQGEHVRLATEDGAARVVVGESGRVAWTE